MIHIHVYSIEHICIYTYTYMAISTRIDLILRDTTGTSSYGEYIVYIYIYIKPETHFFCL